MARRVLLKIVYALTWRTLGPVVVLFRSDRAIAAEMLVLRHENAVLRRQGGRVLCRPNTRSRVDLALPAAGLAGDGWLTGCC